MLSVSFFFYQLVLRMWPGLVQNDLIRHWCIDEKSFGWINSIYYCTYGLMQIPMALLFDRFAYHRVFFISAFLCAFAFFILNNSSDLRIVFLMSGILGGSSAAGVLGMSKVLSLWFPREMYSRMLGLSIGIGLLGCIVGKGSLINECVKSWGFRSVGTGLAIGFMLLAVLMILFMRMPKVYKTASSFCASDCLVLMRSPLMWGLGIVNFLLVGGQAGFADVWGSGYMSVAYGLSREYALDAVQYIFLGVVVGSPLMPWIGKKITDFWVTVLCGFLISGLFVSMMTRPCMYSHHVLRSSMFFLGILCGYQTNLLSLGVDFVDKRFMGVTVGFLNSLNMIGGAFFNAVIGTLMGMNPGAEKTVSDHNIALSIIPIAAIAGSVMLLIIRRLSFWKKISS